MILVNKRTDKVDSIFTCGNEDESTRIWGEVFEDIINNLKDDSEIKVQAFEDKAEDRTHEVVLNNGKQQIKWVVFEL